MEHFRPELETCPICGTKGSCHVHDYYGRTLIDFHAGKRTTSSLCIQRVLAEYFSKLSTVERICEKYDISVNLLRKWLSLWHIHKQHWLGVLTDMETSSISFMQYLAALESYSAYSMEFVRQTSHSFLQCHKNPILKNPKNARYHQQIFLPDYSIN